MAVRRTRKSKAPVTPRFSLEALETRVMLTTLYGGGTLPANPFDPNSALIPVLGDSFEFRQVDGDRVRINVSGNITIQLVGAITDDTNSGLLTNLPGEYESGAYVPAGTEVLGGVDALDGSDLLGPTPIFDSINGGGTTYPGTPSPDITLQALASDDLGNTFAFNVVETEFIKGVKQQVVQLVQLDTSTGFGTVVATLQDFLATDPNTPDPGDPTTNPPRPPKPLLSTVLEVTGADFSPIDGRLYFVAVDKTPTKDAQPKPGPITPRLYSLNTRAGSPGAIAASVIQYPGTFGATDKRVVTVSSIAFNSTGTLYASVVQPGTGKNAGAQGQIVLVFPGSSNIGQGVPITLENVNIKTVTGIEFLPNNPCIPESDFLVGINNVGEKSQLLRIRLSSGGAVALGGTIDKQDPNYNAIGNNKKAVRGEDLEGLTWNPGIVNPYTGDLGTLLATDVSTDELVYLDFRVRPPEANIFTVKILSTDDTGSIAIGAVDDPDPKNPKPRPMKPITGDAGQIRVTNRITGKDFDLNIPANSGAVFIGARTRDIAATPGIEGPYTILSSDLAGSCGLQTVGMGSVVPGLDLNWRLWTYATEAPKDSLIGSGFRSVDGLAFRNDGRAVVVDTSGTVDHIGILGSPAITLVNEIRYGSVNGPELRDVQAIQYGDPEIDGSEALYAIYNVGGTLRLGTIDETSGVFTDLAQVGRGEILQSTAMAISPDGRLFVVGDNAANPIGGMRTLYELNVTDGSVIQTIGTTTDANSGQPVLIGSMDFDLFGNLLAHDLTNSRLVNVSITTAAVGDLVNSGAGTLPNAISVVAYNPAADRWYGVETTSAEKNSIDPSQSASLVILFGATSTSARPQNVGKILIGGTVTGAVNISGSADVFYAGWIATGNSHGQFVSDPDIPMNFAVGGDLHNLVTVASLGTEATSVTNEPQYLSGFELYVGGRMGEVRTAASVAGGIHVVHGEGAEALTTPQGELEHKTSLSFFAEFDDFELNNMPSVVNDSFDTAQYLGSFDNEGFGQKNAAIVEGLIDNTPLLGGLVGDTLDYYALSMMSGQTITVQLYNPNMLPIFVGVYDPDGRIIASDYNHHIPGATLGQPFQFTADRPGAYRFAVAFSDDLSFSGATLYPLGGYYYLSLTGGVGNFGLGAIVANTNVFDARAQLFPPFIANPNDPDTFPDNAPFIVENGEFGAFDVGGDLLHAAGPILNGYNSTKDLIPVKGASIRVDRGNLRAITAANIGMEVNGLLGLGTTLSVPRGSVGLVRSAGLGILNTSWVMATGYVIDPATGLLDDEIYVPKASAVGGNYELVDIGSTFYGGIIANGGLGTMRAGDLATLAPSAFWVNRDGIGADGIIDLVDVAGDFGTLLSGGPAIRTGPGGNVRYLNIEGLLYRDVFFGGGLPEDTVHDVAESIYLTDDSGAKFVLKPDPVIINPAWNPAIPGSEQYLVAAALNVLTYGVRDKGGSIVVSVTSTQGLVVDDDGRSPGQTVELTKVTTGGGGIAPLSTADIDGNITLTRPPAFTVNRADRLDVVMQGPGTVDVMSIEGGGNYTSIVNRTPEGEIVRVVGAGSIWDLAATNLGVGKTHNQSAILPTQILADTFPYSQQRTGIVATDIVSATSSKSLGNFLLSGRLQTLEPNADHARTAGVFEGIVGNIQAGTIGTVRLGEGLMPSGTGNFAHAGIYASGQIDQVLGEELGADVRGDIVSNTKIVSVELNGGAIINSDIFVTATFDQSSELNLTGFGAMEDPDTLSNPLYEIESIKTRGIGGILGSLIVAVDINDVHVEGGFGILDTSIIPLGGVSTVRSVRADGYGIRGGSIIGGAIVGEIIATGDGRQLSSRLWSPSVRFSEKYLFDPFFQTVPNVLTDVNRALRKRAADRIVPGKTNAGIIDGFIANGSRDLGNVVAYKFRNVQLEFANSTGSISVTDFVDRTRVVTGRVGVFSTGKSLYNSKIDVAGPITDVYVGGNVESSAQINATGPAGSIGTVTVAGDFNGSLRSSTNAAKIRIAGNLSAPGPFNDAGQIVPPGINVAGITNEFFVGGSILTGTSMRFGRLSNLFVGGNTEAGALIQAQFLGAKSVAGQDDAIYRIG